ncbi:hypothetical protein BDV95DRAFT_583671 [Massariosphaeria phaeospora]|uniref:F-box domain-containing protein n=1 Tax=Massariosphaeria phaeospora TaxID=100035 RepID=A0A7C8HZW8_9PLEO|nr:hypothetical protein BDV95DRAFT_583671 [Massariosphaeria phaeospora]
MAPLPALLQLPIELRYAIYHHLCREGPICYPFPNSPITSIDSRAPPRQLLLTCRQLCDEVRSYYYGLATLRFLALGSPRMQRQDMSRGALLAIREVKKVELMLMWNMTVHRATADPASWPWWMNGWVEERAQLLKDEGHKLELVIVSLRDASVDASWDKTKRLLAPLQLLKGEVRFEVGEIITVDDVEDSIRRGMEEYITSLNT